MDVPLCSGAEPIARCESHERAAPRTCGEQRTPNVARTRQGQIAARSARFSASGAYYMVRCSFQTLQFWHIALNNARRISMRKRTSSHRLPHKWSRAGTRSSSLAIRRHHSTTYAYALAPIQRDDRAMRDPPAASYICPKASVKSSDATLRAACLDQAGPDSGGVL
jgi:hypothetical protein